MIDRLPADGHDLRRGVSRWRPSPALSADPAPAAVLVVDADDRSRGLVALALRDAGLDVLEAHSGPAAMEVLQTTTVGLVILDTDMPGMSGADAIRALRSRSETVTLPVLLMTGSPDEHDVIQGLEAGADDFVAKPVRLDEFVARVNAHLRRQAAWSHVVEDELRIRAIVVAALARLTISSIPEEAAEAIVRELATRTDSDFVAVLQVGVGGQLHQLATFDRSRGVQRGGHLLGAGLARRMLARARVGPWVEEVDPVGPEGARAFASARSGLAAGAPICFGDDLVGMLTIGITDDAENSPRARRAKLLAAVIDYANVLSTRAGPALADRRDIAATTARLRRVLTAHEFDTVFQPVVELATTTVVGYEALTRFRDGTRPEVRFGEAVAMGMGPEYELATIRAALHASSRLRGDAFVSFNVSPAFVLEGDRRFRQLIARSTRPLVLELTEHAPIDDYRRVRDALAKLGNVGLAVDDAGAGYASLRHILEFRPTYAKLDLSLVRGIDEDDLRQALGAGLQYFASRIGCRLIAEGVESSAEAEVLRRLGIEFAQGYLFGRPQIAA